MKQNANHQEMWQWKIAFSYSSIWVSEYMHKLMHSKTKFDCEWRTYALELLLFLPQISWKYCICLIMLNVFFSRQSLYRGLLPVLCSLYCSNFLYFYTFNGLKTVFVGKGKRSSSLQDLLFGYVAGIVNVLFTTPLWVVNTRLKLQGVTFRSKDLQDNKTKKYNGIIGESSAISFTDLICGSFLKRWF